MIHKLVHIQNIDDKSLIHPVYDQNKNKNRIDDFVYIMDSRGNDFEYLFGFKTVAIKCDPTCS